MIRKHFLNSHENNLGGGRGEHKPVKYQNKAFSLCIIASGLQMFQAHYIVQGVSINMLPIKT